MSINENDQFESFISEGRKLIVGGNSLLYGERAASFQKWSTKLLAFLRQRWPADSDFYRDAASLARNARRAGGVYTQDVVMLLAHLEAAGQIENARARKVIAKDRIPAPSLGLKEVLRTRDLPAMQDEFERATRNVESNPGEAVSAACNIIESACKYFIEDNGLAMPSKQDLRSVWKVVRQELGLETGAVEDDDLKKIVSGMLTAIDGISALRTHASTAHGRGRRSYRLEARHARLAVNSAHTVTMFLLEVWEKRATQPEV